MHWNHRIVNLKSGYGDENWFAVREVYYNDDGTLIGHADPCMGSETMPGLAEQFERQHRVVMEAILDPRLILDEDDFPQLDYEPPSHPRIYADDFGGEPEGNGND